MAQRQLLTAEERMSAKRVLDGITRPDTHPSAVLARARRAAHRGLVARDADVLDLGRKLLHYGLDAPCMISPIMPLAHPERGLGLCCPSGRAAAPVCVLRRAVAPDTRHWFPVVAYQKRATIRGALLADDA